MHTMVYQQGIIPIIPYTNSEKLRDNILQGMTKNGCGL